MEIFDEGSIHVHKEGTKADRFKWLRPGRIRDVWFGKKAETTVHPPTHLKKGIAPIMACIGTPEQFKKSPGADREAFHDIDSNRPGIHNVDYYGNPDDLAKQQFKNAGNYSYVISAIDGSNKFSKSFLNCTGLIVTGKDKETGENISFLSHQDPYYFLDPGNEEKQKRFLNDLKERLKELKEMSVEGTIDAVIVGGNYIANDERHKKNYLDSIKLLSKEVSEVLDFEPAAITGPKLNASRDNVFYDNENRRLYIMRPDVGQEATKGFAPNKIKEQEKKWLL